MNSYNTIVNDWQEQFTNEIKLASKSRKQTFTYLDALQKSKGLRTALDDCMISYKKFIKSNPLQNNDYYKFLKSYSKGIKLNEKYFKHNVKKLLEYYAKFDENENKYCPFNKSQYEEFVLYMMLTLSGNYKQEHDEIFNITFKDSRESNPITRIPSVLRGELPFPVKEYDICRAFYTFICNELGIEKLEDVYTVIDKKTFNTVLNLNHETKGTTIEKVRSQLVCVFGGRVNEVITEERFNEKGKMYRDLTIYEKQAIEGFVTANELKNYVRLHDGLFVSADVSCEVLEVNNVRFSVKECIKPFIENFTTNFYLADEEGHVTTNEKMYSDFLVREGFVRVTEIEHDKITLFKDSNNVIIPFNIRTDMVSFLKSEINEFNTDAIEIKIAKDNNNIIQNSYLLLNPIPLKYHRDTKDTFGIAFKNGFVEFTEGSEKVEVLEYKKVDGFFALHDTQKRDFEFTADPGLSVFQLFLTMVSTGKNPIKDELTKEDESTLISFCSMFGYLIHQYKDPSQSPSIILSDANANDRTRNGGRGKSLVTRAVSQVRKAMLKGGSEFDPAYLFNYADLTKEYDVFIIDDVNAGFNYNALYTQISGAINCQRKGKPAQEIPFSEAPKFVITTNWSYRVEDDSTSTQRRFIEYQFTDFFNINNTPKDVFGHILFDDWDAKEWNRFYNFAFYCVGYYLEFGLQRIQYRKCEDNFRASFNNDVLLEEMDRIINELLDIKNEFSVSDFLNHYKKLDNNLRFENYFHHKNSKSLIDVFIKHNNLKLSYSNRKKWVKI